MKQTILLFFGLLFTVISQAQVWHEGIVEGEGVRYEATNPVMELPKLDDPTVMERIKTPWFIVRNTNTDTTTVRGYFQPTIASCFAYEIIEILYKHLSREEIASFRSPKGYATQEELEQLKSLPRDAIAFPDDAISFDLRVDSVASKVLQVSHITWQRQSFWMNFSPDRLYRIEQDIVANVKGPAYSIFQKLYGSKYELTVKIFAGGLVNLAGYTPEERLYWKNESLKRLEEFATSLETDKEAFERMKRWHGIRD